MLFNELRLHGKLAAKRHPMYEKNKIGKYIMYASFIFWGAYFIFIGIGLAKAICTEVPNMEAYHILNSGLIFALALDFVIRFPFQKTPTQEVKPYLLLPVKRSRILDFLLLRHGLSSFNLIWLFLFVPFAALTVFPFYGISGVLTYSIGIWLLMVFNGYWYLLCRTLINEHIWWVVLPIVVYSGIAIAIFIPKTGFISNFFMNLGEGYIEGNLLAYLGTLAATVLVWCINRKVMTGLIYNEINKVEDTKVKTVSEYRFLERFGEVGEYMRLELKMLLRNKRCKASLRSVAMLVIIFSIILSFSSTYDHMKSFVQVYSFLGFGMVILIQLMGFEGNYIDGLMTRKESIKSLLTAKYYIYSLAEIIPLILLIPAFVMGKASLLGAVALIFLTTGPVYCILFQLAVYNHKTVPLNESITGKQSMNTGMQMLISFGLFIVPTTLYGTLPMLLGQTWAYIVILIIGLGFTLTSPMWINNVYVRFMQRRYENMEGFRDSK